MNAVLHPTTAVAFSVLVAASLLSDYSLPLDDLQVRPEHIAAPVVFAALVFTRLARREAPLRMDAFTVLAGGWVLTNAVSSWLFAPQPAESLVHVLRMSLLAAIFLTVANLPLTRASNWVTAFRLWLGLGILELGYGLFIWLLVLYGDVWLPGAFEEPIVGISIKGTLYERNLFGILAGTLLLVASYGLLAQRFHKGTLAPTGFLVVACTLAAATVVLSVTRSAWVAVVAAAPLAILVFDRRRWGRSDRPLRHMVVGLPVLLGLSMALFLVLPAPDRPRAVVATTAPPGATVTTQTPVAASGGVASAETGAHPTGTTAPASTVTDRLSTFGRLQSDFTLSTRVSDARWALEDWWARPILGHGTGSFGQIHGRRAGSDAWISNVVLHTMVDTGLIGLAVQLSLLLLVARRAWHAACVTREPQLAIGLKAMTLGLLVMVVSYQVTDGTWFAVFWIHLGLMVNGIYCVRRERTPLRDSV